MTEKILIVGGGIAGLGLARALSQRGVPCTVVERGPAPTAAGLGLNLPGNAVQALAALGFADEVVERGRPIRRREYRNGSGRLLFAVDEEAFWDTPSVGVRRGDLLDVLRREVPTRWGTTVDRIEDGPAGVRVELATGASSSGAVETYDLVVGADGVHSTVRAAVLPGGDPRPSRMTETSWRFVAPNPGVGCWTVWSGRAGTFLLMPLPRDLVYGYASATRGGAAAADPHWLGETFAGFPEPVPTAVAAALADGSGLYHSAVEEVRGDRWSRGRVLLIGDAAHATAPVWAQGAALALEDALVLADLLAASRDRDGVGPAFERLRRPRVAHVQAATDRMSRIARIPGLLRDVAAPVVGPKAYRSTYGPLRSPVVGDRGGALDAAREPREDGHGAVADQLEG